MSTPSFRPVTHAGTPDKPKRYLIEKQFTDSSGNLGTETTRYALGQYGRPGETTATRILGESQRLERSHRQYHYVVIIDQGAHINVSQAGEKQEPVRKKPQFT
jgi:hypothetical protein